MEGGAYQSAYSTSIDDDGDDDDDDEEREQDNRRWIAELKTESVTEDIFQTNIQLLRHGSPLLDIINHASVAFLSRWSLPSPYILQCPPACSCSLLFCTTAFRLLPICPSPTLTTRLPLASLTTRLRRILPRGLPPIRRAMDLHHRSCSSHSS